MMTIRPFNKSDDDYSGVLDVSNALWPDEKQGLSELKHEDASRDPKYMHRRFVGEVNGRIVAYGVCSDCCWSYVEGKCLVLTEVHPDFHGRGYGTQFLKFLLDEAAGLGANALVTWTRDDKPDYIRFVKKQGFEFAMRYAVSRLDLGTLDLSGFDWTGPKMRETGIEILCLTELSEIDPNWKRTWYDLGWELMQDVPSVDRPTRPTFETWCSRFDNPSYRTNLHWFAMDGDRPVGYTGLWLSEADPEKIFTGLTGVVRSHRRRGIATALKVHGFRRAKELGAKFIETDNEEHNPMFDLNMRLGFKPVPAWTEYRRSFDAAAHLSSAADRKQAAGASADLGGELSRAGEATASAGS